MPPFALVSFQFLVSKAFRIRVAETLHFVLLVFRVAALEGENVSGQTGRGTYNQSRF